MQRTLILLVDLLTPVLAGVITPKASVVAETTQEELKVAVD